MAEESNAQAIEAWKQKYYDSLEQAERKEKEWKRVDDLLRRAIQRLTLAADGLDQTLDGQLRDLRDAIRESGKSFQLEASIEAMSATLVKLDGKRARARAAMTAPDVVETLLDKITLPKSHGKSVKELKKRARAVEDEQVPALVDEFTQLLSTALTPESSAPESAGGGGLFGKLFSRKDAAPRSELVEPVSELRDRQPAAAPTPKDQTPGQRDMLLHLLERLAGHSKAVEIFKELRERVLRARTEQELKRIADTLAEGLSGAPASTPASPSADQGSEVSAEIPPDAALASDDSGEAPANRIECDFRDALVQLLERLAMPANFEARVDALKERLEDSSAPLESDTVLCEMAELVAEMRIEIQREKTELEDFLQHLTTRLQDIDSVVLGTESKRVASFENGRDLGNKVQAQILGIESSVRNVQEIDQLKSAVKLNVDAIIAHMEEHRKVEEQRNREVEAEVQALRGRLSELESESEELRSKVHYERNQAMTDALTGVPNRLAWDERIIQEYARWKRFQTPLALLVWDVDYFKKVNDDYGHKAGDKVLKVIANLLQENIRETDFLARYGGEEFVLLMTGAQDADVAAVAEKLRKAIEDCGFHYKGQEVPITISCGRTHFQPGDNIEAAFERADQALYRAKEAGRNRCISADN